MTQQNEPKCPECHSDNPDFRGRNAEAQLAEKDKEIERLRKERDDFQVWANCGGVPIGRECSSPKEPGHKIFGPHVGMGDGTFQCEFHYWTTRAETAEARVKELEAELELLREQKPFGWWDVFNAHLYSNEQAAQRARDGGNEVFPVYRAALAPTPQEEK